MPNYNWMLDQPTGRAQTSLFSHQKTRTTVGGEVFFARNHDILVRFYPTTHMSIEHSNPQPGHFAQRNNIHLLIFLYRHGPPRLRLLSL